MANVERMIIFSRQSDNSSNHGDNITQCNSSAGEHLNQLEDALELEFKKVRSEYMHQVDLLRTQYGRRLNSILNDITRVRCEKMKASN